MRYDEVIVAWWFLVCRDNLGINLERITLDWFIHLPAEG